MSAGGNTQLALDAAKYAVEHDIAGRAKEAIYYYELSIDLLSKEPMPPNSPYIQKMDEYAARVAHLKSTTPFAVVRVSSQPPTTPKEEDTSPLGLAVTNAEKAVEADTAGKYKEALLLYLETCEMFMQLIRSPDIPDETKNMLRERLSAYTVRKEVVQRLAQSQQPTFQPTFQPQFNPYSATPYATQPPPHPYLTQAYPQPTFNGPSSSNPVSTPVSNPVPFGLQTGQARYVDPLHKPTIHERLKRLGL